MEPSTISGTNLRTAFVLLLVVAVTVLFLAVAWPFLKPLLLGALLSGLFHPLYRWITRLLGGRASLGAAVTLLVLLVLGLGPVSAFLGIVLQQALTMSDQAIPWLSQPWDCLITHRQGLLQNDSQKCANGAQPENEQHQQCDRRA